MYLQSFIDFLSIDLAPRGVSQPPAKCFFRELKLNILSVCACTHTRTHTHAQCIHTDPPELPTTLVKIVQFPASRSFWPFIESLVLIHFPIVRRTMNDAGSLKVWLAASSVQDIIQELELCTQLCTSYPDKGRWKGIKIVGGTDLMKFVPSPVNGRLPRRAMPIHLNGVVMAAPMSHRQAMGFRTSSLEMLNNTDFEEKRAIIASTLSLNDLLKPSHDYRAGHASSPKMGHAQFSPVTSNGYLVPQSLMKHNSAGHSVNFLNNGTLEKDLGKKKPVFFKKANSI